ncbi:IS200/IS605 family transposase [Fusobacterium animalis]|uniref:IS200/IS605 family transposase n=1 Tax=Fusobacterium animalis TaxID=76859 RepID=UPI003CC6139A
MSNINFGRGYVYSIQYHIVWCVKYRRKVLIDDIEKTLKELLIEISNENNIKIVEMETDLDHIHILIECSPQHFIPNILKIFKGISARKLKCLKRLENLKRKRDSENLYQIGHLHY